jgi:hypothetical protein
LVITKKVNLRRLTNSWFSFIFFHRQQTLATVEVENEYNIQRGDEAEAVGSEGTDLEAARF